MLLELLDIQNEREKKLIDQALEDEKSLLDYQEGKTMLSLICTNALTKLLLFRTIQATTVKIGNYR